MTKEKLVWQKVNNDGFSGGNEILQAKGFYISFNGNRTSAIENMPPFRGDSMEGETALCKGEKFFILNGDHRKQYEKLVKKGWKACKAYFDKNAPKLKSSWSN